MILILIDTRNWWAVILSETAKAHIFTTPSCKLSCWKGSQLKQTCQLPQELKIPQIRCANRLTVRWCLQRARSNLPVVFNHPLDAPPAPPHLALYLIYTCLIINYTRLTVLRLWARKYSQFSDSEQATLSYHGSFARGVSGGGADEVECYTSPELPPNRRSPDRPSANPRLVSWCMS